MKEEMYEYFNAIEERHWWFRARRQIVLRLIDRYRKQKGTARVLDVGCGTGATLKALAAYGTLTGLDKNAKAVEYSKKRVPEAKVIQGSFPGGVPGKQFDIITILDVLEHLDEDQEALGKLAQHLAAEGITIITVPAYAFLWTGHDDMNEHKRRYTLPELKEKALGAGLTIRKISYYNTFLFFPIAAAKIMRRLLNRRTTAHFGAVPPPAFINAPLQAIFSLEKHFLPHMNFPFGISIIAVASKK